MAALPYMQLYVADYLADTAHLDALEHGIYLMLMMNYWQTGKPLPAGDRRLARIARCTDEQFADAKQTLCEFFEITPDAWMHKRCDRDLKKVKRKSEQHKTAANIRWNKGKTHNANAYADAKRKQCHTDTDTEEEKGVLKSTPKKDIRSAFDNYNDMAKKVGLPHAQIITAKRSAAIGGRLKEAGGLEGWNHALALVEANSFFAGDNERGWKADLDFIATQSKFTKIMEGSYAKARPVNGGGATDNLKRKLAEQHQRMFSSGSQDPEPLDG